MSDPIDREKIIGFANELEQRALKLSNNDSEDILYKTVRTTIKAICEYCEKLPSAQLEIIYCKKCKHWTETCGDKQWGLGDCDVFDKHLVMCNGYCAWAERREE